MHLIGFMQTNRPEQRLPCIDRLPVSDRPRRLIGPWAASPPDACSMGHCSHRPDTSIELPPRPGLFFISNEYKAGRKKLESRKDGAPLRQCSWRSEVCQGNAWLTPCCMSGNVRQHQVRIWILLSRYQFLQPFRYCGIRRSALSSLTPVIVEF